MWCAWIVRLEGIAQLIHLSPSPASQLVHLHPSQLVHLFPQVVCLLPAPATQLAMPVVTCERIGLNVHWRWAGVVQVVHAGTR